MQTGFVYLIGAGPGNPDLLTIRGLKAIQASDIILFDALLGKEYLEVFPKNAKVKFVGKRCGKHSHTQPEINSMILQYALSGYKVARLKGGDPFLYGRGGEELLAIREAEIPYEIIPGVTSMNAASAAFQIPVTHRGISRKVLMVNGHGIQSLAIEEWQTMASFQGTIVIFMGTSSFQFMANKLLDHGARSNLPVALIENASLAAEQITISSLRDAASNGILKKTNGPGIIYIGDVIQLFHNPINLKSENKTGSRSI
ncbi:MAG: uroporphyrinogen-III C-methyltransferase [Spirochaetota bacterium]